MSSSLHLNIVGSPNIKLNPTKIIVLYLLLKETENFHHHFGNSFFTQDSLYSNLIRKHLDNQMVFCKYDFFSFVWS